MLLLLPLWAVLAGVLVGWGLLALWLLDRAGIRGALTGFQTLWLGYGSLLAFLLLWAFVFPIDRATLIASALPALAGYALRRSQVRAGLRRPPVVVAILAGVVALVVAYVACDKVTSYDTNLYHSQVVQWNARFSAVPGLANLHQRFGYDNSIHLFATFVDAFWQGEAVHAMNGFLMVVMLLQWITQLFTATTPRGRLRQTFCLFTLPFLLAKVWYTEIPSLSSDLPLALFSLVLVLELLSWQRGRTLTTTLILVLGAIAMTTKLGGLALFGVAVIAAFATMRLPRKTWLKLLALPAAITFLWVARNAVVSGWLIFPVFGHLPVAWAVPREIAADHLRWIESWARLPQQPQAAVLDHGFLHWFTPWFEGFRQTKEMTLIAVSGALIAWRAIGPRWSAGERIATAACLLGLVQWFVGAPDLRFGGFLFWTLPAVLFAPLICGAMRDQTTRPLVLALGLALCAWSGGFTPRLDEVVPKLIDRPIAPPRMAVIATFTTSGAFVFLPIKGDQCGDELIPCTPEPAHQQQRDPDRLGAGYTFGAKQ